ncbi:hypothetical protein NMK71_07060 [Weeksellaceae bacterium KMM 9713]|uniref:Uncharacterized protein n=1 Tax=Profundicola chukchiensis TaxID=2961959 RepID=A0A9X4RVU4_9FLAO|nr:hypothetical protein [Profundicola chukchiensis]MDG4946170.1 hypothetical protein [Profundicola chukchiensis]
MSDLFSNKYFQLVIALVIIGLLIYRMMNFEDQVTDYIRIGALSFVLLIALPRLIKRFRDEN